MNDDPLAQKLAALPDDPLDPRAAAAVLRRARGTLVEEGRPAARLARTFSSRVLPAMLVACALVYAWGAVLTLGQVYVASR